MRKKDDKPSLGTVNESSEEEVLLLEGQFVAENEGKVRLEVKDRSALKFRTHEPKVEEWSGQEEASIEDEWNSEIEPTRFHKVFWISIGLILVAGIAWLVIELSQLKQQEITSRADTKILKEHEQQAESEAVQTIAAINEVVRKFYGSSSVDEMAKYVRHSERVRPMMENYYSKNPINRAEVNSLVEMNPLMIGTAGGFWVILTKLSSGVDGKLVVEVKSPTEVLVDWETHVCAQPMEWEQFVKDRPAEYRGDFRVYVEWENFYNYEFVDSQKYQAFKLTTLNSYEVIYGYALRDGQAFKSIESLLKLNKNQKLPLMLRLYLQEGMQSKSGVLIEEMVSPRWLLVNSPEVKK